MPEDPRGPLGVVPNATFAKSPDNVRGRMSARALAPSPVARRLFELAERRADGTLDVGGRTIALRRGRIVDVGAAESDESLIEFMVRAGRIDAGLAEEASRRVRSKSIDGVAALASVGVRATELRSARRALFLDRLVRGLGHAEQNAGGLSAFVPDATFAESDHDEDLPPLVLDALERRAGENDAGLVGERANEIVHFSDGPFEELARRYVNQPAGDAKPPAVYEILRRSPAAASRIAALVRAGLVLLQPEQHGAPPPRRPKSIAPAPTTGGGAHSRAPGSPMATTSHEGPRFRDTLRPGSAPAREPVMRLEPGMTALEPHEFADAGELPVIPAYVGPLADPLDVAERAVAQLEQAQASGRERAQAWLAFGRAWLRHCASIDEAARCAREAAAADPANLIALRESTHLCAAMGRVDLGRAYARATVHYAADDEARSEGLLDLARLAERDGDVDAALASLEEASKIPSGASEAFTRLAALSYARSDVERAVRAAANAANASVADQPLVARAWAEWAQMLASNADAAIAESRAIERLGRPAVASAILAARARAPFDPTTRQRLLVEAADIAERADRYDMAFARMREAHVADPELEALYEPLVAYAERALEPDAFAALVEGLAVIAPEESRAVWLGRAADAFERVGTAGAWALELRARALLADPSSDEAVAEMRAHAERASVPSTFADAIERLIRSNRIVDAALAGRRLLELADHCENVLGAAPRALWALERCMERAPEPGIEARRERLVQRVRMGDAALAAAEAELASAPEASRSPQYRKLGALLRDLPDARHRAIDLYRTLLAEDSNDSNAAVELERLLAIVGEDEELRLLFTTRALDEAAGADRTRRMQHWAGLAALHHELDDAVAAAEAWLAAEPGSEEAAFRLEAAARASGDPTQLRDALDRRIATAKRDPEHAMLLLERGLLDRASGDLVSTVSFADQARLVDPHCIDALVILLEELPRLEAAPALEVVRMAREALGDTPQLLLVGADLAATVGDDVARRAFIDARCAIAQDAPAVAQLRVDRAIEEDDPSAILAAAQEALSRASIVAATPFVIERALEAIAKHDPGDAATVAIHAADRLGESRFAELALRYAEQSGLHERRVAALERWVAWSSGAARCEHLRSLAAVHRESNLRANEARSWLRLLADNPTADDACERLATIYAETRDAERLLAVLGLRLEGASTPEQRESRLLHLAAASALVLEDVDRAEGFLRRLVSESPEPTTFVGRAAAALVKWQLPLRAIDWLLSFAEAAADEPAERLFGHAVFVAEEVLKDHPRTIAIAEAGLTRFPSSAPLLLAFERAAFASKAIDDAKRIYASVEANAIGSHTLRGVVYRRARFLERAGDKPAALEAYLDAFRLAPGEGVVFTSIERLAGELQCLDKLVDAMLVLIDRTVQLDRRMVLLRQVATVCETRMSDPGRAFDLLFETWKSTQRSELLPDVRRLARAIAMHEPERAASATAEILTTLTARVDDSWDADDQIRCLRLIGDIELDDRGDLDAAIDCVDRGLGVANDNEDINLEEAAELACDGAESLNARGDAAEAARYFGAAAKLAPTHERVVAMSRVLSVPIPETADGTPFRWTRQVRKPAAAAAPAVPTAAAMPPPPAPMLASAPAPSPAEVATEPVATESDEPELEVGDTDAEPEAEPEAELAPEPDATTDDEPVLEMGDGADDDEPADASDELSLPEPRERKVSVPAPQAVRAAAAPVSTELDSEEALMERAEAGDCEALRILAERLRDIPSRADERASMLCHLLRAEPQHAQAFSDLVEAARLATYESLAEVAATIASVFDDVVAPPISAESPSRVAGSIAPMLRQEDEAAQLATLTLLWESVLPLQRRTLSHFGVTGVDKVGALGQRPIAKLAPELTAALGLPEVPVYVRKDAQAPAVVLPVQPPAVLVRASLEDDPPNLRASLARALATTAPDCLFVTAFTEDQGRGMISALIAAFGPPNLVSEVARESAAVAAELWNVVPQKKQAQLREALEKTPEYFDWDAAVKVVENIGARASLFTGNLASSLRALAASDERFAELMTTPEGFSEAVLASPSLAALLREALSDAHLSAR